MCPIALALILSAGYLQTFDRVAPPPGSTLVEEASTTLARARGGSGPDATVQAVAAALLAPATAAPDYESVRFLLWNEGLADARFLPYRGRFETLARARAALPGVVEELAAGIPYDRFGVATVQSATAVEIAIVVLERQIALPEIPRAVVAGTNLSFTVTARAPREARILHQDPAGKTRPFELGMVGLSPVAARIPLGTLVGRHDFEVVFVEESGPAIVAAFAVHAGEPVPARYVAARYTVEAGKRPDAEIATRLLALLNGTRERYALPRLAADPMLGSVARAHSAEMKRTGFGRAGAGHGALADRLVRAKALVRDAAELIASGPSAAALHASLLASPAHRLALLDPRLTHVGVGVATVSGKKAPATCFGTLVLAAVVPKVDPQKTAAAILAAMNTRRKAANLAPLAADPRLAAIAARHAQDMSAAGTPGYELPGGTSLFDAAKPAAPGAKAIGGFVGVLSGPEDEIAFEGLLDPAMQRGGVGVVQASSEEFGAGALWVAIVLVR